MNTLFTKAAGIGEPLVVLHGWGMNHTVWSPIAVLLECHFRVTWVDLPGHGQSNKQLLGELDDAVDAIAALLVGKRVHLMGWSLGGLIAQRLAIRFPEKVKSLLLVSTSPSFVVRDHWPHAMPEHVLNGFVDSLESDFELTIKRFLSLQFMGIKGVQADVKRLRADILAQPPQLDALRAGLSILKHTDLREAEIVCPQYWVLGALDKLIPVSVAKDLSARGVGSVYVMQAAGHAPFISHPEEFVSKIRDFVLGATLGVCDD